MHARRVAHPVLLLVAPQHREPLVAGEGTEEVLDVVDEVRAPELAAFLERPDVVEGDGVVQDALVPERGEVG